MSPREPGGPVQERAPATLLRFGGTSVSLEGWGSVTTLPDGRTIQAAPQAGEDYAATARRLGYGADVLAMCHEHDALHAALAALLGLPVSPVLSTVAGVPIGDAVQHGLEEDAVLAVTRWARSLGVEFIPLWSGRNAG